MALAPTAPRPHFLYVIGTRRNGKLTAPVKVGITSRCDSRLKSIQTGSAHPLEFGWVFTLPTKAIARSLEGSFHRACRPSRLSGEWFDMPPEKAIGLVCISLSLEVMRVFKGHTADAQREAFERTRAAEAVAALGHPPIPFEDVP